MVNKNTGQRSFAYTKQNKPGNIVTHTALLNYIHINYYTC